MPLRPYDPGDPRVLEIAVADSDAVWSPRKFAIGKSEYSPLGFWSKALLSSVDKYCPFERQLLACYWALETKCLATDHQSTLQHELPIVNQVSYLPSHKVGHTQK